MHVKQNAQIRLDECHFMESIDESPRANLAHPNFFTFYTAKGVKGRLFSLLSLKCASNEQRGSVRGTLGYYIPPSDLGCRGTT